MQAVFVHVDAGYRQRVGRYVGARHLHLGPGHGRQHGQAAVTRAQVQHLAGVVAQVLVSPPIDQQFGNEAARHDGAFVHVERYTLQPGLLCEIGGGLAGADALFKKSSYQRLIGGRYGLILHGIGGFRQITVQRQP
ncbi:hypothetical protein D3C71_1105770 [compost metagenome]